MNAIKVSATISPDHALHVQLPTDFGPGPAEVIVLFPAEPRVTKPRKAGSAKGLVQMAKDFDAPLADFKEYMP